MELVLGLQLEEMVRFPNQQRTLISRVSLALHWPSAKITSFFFKVHNSILHIFLIIFHELKKKKKKREKNNAIVNTF